MRIKRRLWCLVFALYAAGSGALFARDITVTVTDGDLGVALEGALVQLPDGSQVRCDRQGRAVCAVPDGRDSILRVTYPGYETYRLFAPAGGSAALNVLMRMSAMRENRELVIEADRSAGTAGAQTGRSVSVSGEALTRTAEIGAIEDVMTSIKLLPGVGYAGGANVHPSIRGGEPGDLMAVYDGFYIDNPYFWNGAFSIFDPRAVEKAQLYHGIFSARYGHTTSGLLEISSRRASRAAPEFEIGVSTSTANVNLAHPLGEHGGFMLMGKVTYYDPIFWLAKAMANYAEELEPVRAFVTPPYIRTFAVSADYDLSPRLSLKLNGFLGADGVGLDYRNEMGASSMPDNVDSVNIYFDYYNIKSFLTTQIRYTPAPAFVLKTTLGTGYTWGSVKGAMNYDQRIKYNDGFYTDWQTLEGYFKTRWGADLFFRHDDPYGDPDWYPVKQKITMDIEESKFNAQGRADFDWDTGAGFVIAGGAQELWSSWSGDTAIKDLMIDGKVESLANELGLTVLPPGLSLLDVPGYISIPITRSVHTQNKAFNTGAYALVEWASPQRKVGAELGLRLDHIYFVGRDFEVNARPALNPRLNVDVNIFRERGPLDSLDLTAGTGFFTSMTDSIYAMQNLQNTDSDIAMKQNRSWSNLLGARLEFLDWWVFNIEGYYKYGFDRAYQLTLTKPDGTNYTDFYFDGESHISGFDLMLQRSIGRFIDGWISYSFTYARYRNRWRTNEFGQLVEEDIWRYPRFHRFHNLNVVLSVKPSPKWAISGRFGFASGAPLAENQKADPVPVLVMPGGIDKPESAYLIQKYKSVSTYSDTRRDGYSLSLDLKFSRLLFNKKGKAQGEMYFAVENCLFFVKSRERNTTFNQYTGEEDEGSQTASYQAPIPIPSFGFTYSY